MYAQNSIKDVYSLPSLPATDNSSTRFYESPTWDMKHLQADSQVVQYLPAVNIHSLYNHSDNMPKKRGFSYSHGPDMVLQITKTFCTGCATSAGL